MKTLDFEKMEQLEGGSNGAACFGAGLAAMFSLSDPSGWYGIWRNRELLSYCWNS